MISEKNAQSSLHLAIFSEHLVLYVRIFTAHISSCVDAFYLDVLTYSFVFKPLVSGYVHIYLGGTFHIFQDLFTSTSMVQFTYFRMCSHLPRRYNSHVSGCVHIYLSTSHIQELIHTYFKVRVTELCIETQ